MSVDEVRWLFAVGVALGFVSLVLAARTPRGSIVRRRGAQMGVVAVIVAVGVAALYFIMQPIGD